MDDRDSLVEQAEAGGHSEMLGMALDYLYGQSGPVDLWEARRWFERILASGDTSRILEVSLGRLLVNGEGGPRDLIRGLAMLHPHGHQDTDAAIHAARAARMLASEQYGFVVSRTDRAQLEAGLEDGRPDGQSAAVGLFRRRRRVRENRGSTYGNTRIYYSDRGWSR